MSQAKGCPTRLISDLPAEQDAFGLHERVAKAIADLVRHEDGGKTIALRGGWGSGKSTVVNLLKQKLDPDPHVTVWVFDAWAHQGDPLRRTFLERLIIHLVGEEWVNKQRWEKRREELARRRKTTETEEIPRLTDLAKMLSFLLWTLPVGTALLGSGLPDNWALAGPGLALILLPVLAILAYALWGQARYSGTAEDHALWALFVSKTVTHTRTETIEEPDPTSVEFEDIFAALMNDAFAGGERRMVLVLDNLDRVDAADALSIWSTLQTFLHHQEHSEPDWFKKLWVLIPHDPEGIRQLWKAEGKPSSRSASAFLDKSFQVGFEVSPPVLSDWHGYLLRLLKEALPEHDEGDFHDVYGIFAQHRMKAASSPTPRDLKLYVNDIGALHRQRQHDFPLSHLAYYVLLRRDDRDVPRGLLGGDLPEPELATPLGEEVQDSLAALAFGVDVPRGRQLLLRDPIQSALTAGDSARLRELAENVLEGFWEVLQIVMAEGAIWRNEPANLAKAARALDESGLLYNQSRPEAMTVMQTVRDAASKVKSWSPFDDPTAQGIASLCRLLRPDAESVVHLLAGISASLIRPTEGHAAGEVPPETWADSFLVVVRELQSLGLADRDRHRVSVPADSGAWIELCHRIALQDPDGAFWRFLQPQAPASDIASVLADLARNGKFSRAHLGAVRVSTTAGTQGGWSDLVAAFKERMGAANSIPGPEIAASFEALWELRPVESSAGELLDRLGTQGYALHHLSQAASEGNDEASAWCMFTFLRAVPSAGAPPEVGQSQAGHTTLTALLSSPGGKEATISAFVDLIARVGELELLFRMLDASPQSEPFVVYCLKIASQGPEAGQLFTPDVVTERWPFLVKAFDGSELDSLIQRLNAETGLAVYVRELGFDPILAGLYAALVRAGAASEAAFRSWCLSGLKVVSKDLWLTQLSEDGELVNLIIELQRRGIKVILELEYQDALAEHGALVASGNPIASEHGYSWSELLKPLTQGKRKMLRRKLYDAVVAVVGPGGDVADSFFALYGEEISSSELLRERDDAPYRLFTPFLRLRKVSALRWVADVLKSDPKLADHFKPETLDEFKEVVRRELAEDKGDDASSIIQEIAEALHVKVERQEAPNE